MSPHPKTQFSIKGVYRHKQPHAFYFATQRYSFWVATFSLFAFVVGNMVGQHGWYAFWHSVFGRTDDSTIVFTGTVQPIDEVPDYTKWAMYGGNPLDHTYRMVPKDILIPLPVYDSQQQRKSYEDSVDGDVYSIANMGSYATGAEGDGSHVGIDIRVPIGTPVLSIANGVVEKVRDIKGGFGRYLVVRHPNVPDSGGRTKTLYSIYAHLDSVLVSEGMIVKKGEHIANSGQTGYASGPHLHFQIDKASAPFHPYWPFTSTEARDSRYTFAGATNARLNQENGYQNTLNPMLFVQQYENHQSVVARSSIETESILRERKLTPRERMIVRRSKRLARAQIVNGNDILSVRTESKLSSSSKEPQKIEPTSVQHLTQAVPTIPAYDVRIVPPSGQQVRTLAIEHDGKYKRGWEKVYISALDENGDLVRNPSFTGKIYLRAGFGAAEFRPFTLTERNFKSGIATVHVLPRGSKRTLIIETRGAIDAESRPMEYRR